MPKLPRFRVVVLIEVYDNDKVSARNYVASSLEHNAPFANWEIQGVYKLTDGEVDASAS